MARKRTHTRRPARLRPRGILELHKGGYGFVKTAEGEFFIPRSKVRDGFPDDLVEIAPIKSPGRKMGTSDAHRHREARVVSVIERATSELVGVFSKEESLGVVVPLDERIQHDIFIAPKASQGVEDGSIVRVRIDNYPDRYTAATGTILEVLGDETDERIPIDLIVARHKFETEFSEASKVQARAAMVSEDEALAAGYRDLRDRFIFTIDPEDARDFDDAVSLEEAQLPSGRKGYCLGVSIADVSAYVEWNSSLDLDARRRATSVYLVDRVIPMLPEELSNDLCSLKPGEDRRCLTVDMLVANDGKIEAVEIYPALMRSAARLSYGQALAILNGQKPESLPGPKGLSGNLLEVLSQKIQGLAALAQAFRQRREAAGGLDFDTTEAKVRLDSDGRPLSIDLRTRNQATELIEEAMIAANEAVARTLSEADFPCIYRVHEAPAADALGGLVPVLQEFPWFKAQDSSAVLSGNPHALQKVLEAAVGRPEEELVTSLVLRAMMRATYSPQKAEHYGLASSAYCHFTSPIRRYPDLVVHRMVKAWLWGRPEKFDQEVAALGWLSEHSSKMEREAEAASRESQEVKIVEYMEAFIGETFSATIAGVANFGLFVRLDNTAEGVVEISDLGDEYFVLDGVRHTLTGSESGKVYRLGRRLAVRLVEADCLIHRLRFKLV